MSETREALTIVDRFLLSNINQAWSTTELAMRFGYSENQTDALLRRLHNINRVQMAYDSDTGEDYWRAIQRQPPTTVMSTTETGTTETTTTEETLSDRILEYLRGMVLGAPTRQIAERLGTHGSRTFLTLQRLERAGRVTRYWSQDRTNHWSIASEEESPQEETEESTEEGSDNRPGLHHIDIEVSRDGRIIGTADRVVITSTPQEEQPREARPPIALVVFEWLENHPAPPVYSTREISEGVGNSRGLIFRVLCRLERNGRVVRLPSTGGNLCWRIRRPGETPTSPETHRLVRRGRPRGYVDIEDIGRALRRIPDYAGAWNLRPFVSPSKPYATYTCFFCNGSIDIHDAEQEADLLKKYGTKTGVLCCGCFKKVQIAQEIIGSDKFLIVPREHMEVKEDDDRETKTDV